jgi:hypothetical protein
VSAQLRIYLTGTVCLEYGGMVVDERQLPAWQGRLVLAYLIGERSRPVTRDELGGAIWSDSLPTAWESALSALVSKLRHLLQSLGLPATVALISGRSGRYQMQLPSNTWTARGPVYRQQLCHRCRGAGPNEPDGACRQNRDLGRYPHGVQGAIHCCR